MSGATNSKAVAVLFSEDDKWKIRLVVPARPGLQGREQGWFEGLRLL